jgi:tetratricopeptide (TPR) repeat protein
VIGDVASHMADWRSLRPTPAWPVEAWFAGTARLLVVMLFVLSIFAVSVPIATGLASAGQSLRMVLGDSFGGGPGSLPEPKDAESYAARGDAYRAKGHFDRAIADHSKAIELDPNYAVAYNDRGNAYQSKGDHDRAIADYTKAIEINPGLIIAYINRAAAYRTKGDLDAAVADYTKAIELDSNPARIYIQRGGVYETRSETALALADYAKAVELEPQNYAYVRGLGAVKYGMADFPGAAADMARALELKADAYSMLFRYLARSRAGEAAGSELETNAARLTSKDWPYAAVELYLGKRTPAATLGSTKKPNERCEAQFYIGQWHVVKGNTAEAATALKAAVDTCPKTFVEYQAAVAELKRIKP